VEYGTQLSDKVKLSLAGWYGTLGEYTYNEFDAVAALSYNAGPVNLIAGFTWYHYADGAALDNQYEPSIGISSNGLPVDLFATAYYESEVDGYYYEVGAGKTVALTDCIGLRGAVVLGYNDGLTVPGSGLNHVNVMLSAPIALSKSVLLTPYVAGNFAQDATKGLYKDDNIFYGGVSVAISF
jgi:hypothetical protein